MGAGRTSAFQEITVQQGKHLDKYIQEDHRLKKVGKLNKC